MKKIANATATYTGGGIYIYTGETSDGEYFMFDDSFYEYVAFFDADPCDFDNSLYEEWELKHHIGDYSNSDAKEYIKRVIEWIINKKPKGNYSETELQERLKKLS